MHQDDIESGRQSPAGAFAALRIAIGDRLLDHPDISPVTLMTERKHFQSNMARNNRQAKRLRIKRGKNPDIRAEELNPNRLLPSSQAKGPFGPRGVPVDRAGPGGEVQNLEILSGEEIGRALREHAGKSNEQLRDELEKMRAQEAQAQAVAQSAEPIRHPEDQEEDFDQEEDLKLDIVEPQP